MTYSTVIENISEEMRPRFSACYIFLMAGHAWTIKHENVQGPNNQRLLEFADTVIDVIDGVFHMAKNRNPDDREILLHSIAADRVIELETSPENWAAFKSQLLHGNALHGLVLPELIKPLGGKMHWLEAPVAEEDPDMVNARAQAERA